MQRRIVDGHRAGPQAFPGRESGPGMIPIHRFGRNPGAPGSPLARSCPAVAHNGTVYTVVIANKPYDPRLSAAEQTRQVLRRVEERLAAAVTNKSRLLMVQIMLSDMRHFAGMNEVWDAWIDQENPPVRCCWTADLGHPDLKVEMVVLAAAMSGG
jgi:enamine deaminase RidA (YjgF/YER057c/UK114 family)